jgi:nucleotide-binding universal stress UspA family protein
MQETNSRILVPVDFSDCSREALQHAEALARQLEVGIDVLHVWQPAPRLWPYVVEPIREEVLEDLRRDLMTFLRDVPDELAARVFLHLATGVIVDEILSAAGREAVDLIIMGTHGRRGLAHLFQGSVAEKVLRRAPCPVLVVRASSQQQSRDRKAA